MRAIRLLFLKWYFCDLKKVRKDPEIERIAPRLSWENTLWVIRITAQECEKYSLAARFFCEFLRGLRGHKY